MIPAKACPVPRYGTETQLRAAGPGDCYIISSFEVANQQRSYSQATADLRASLIGCNDLDRIMRPRGAILRPLRISAPH